MNHHATKRFWECYGALPERIRHAADQNFGLLKENPSHQSLRLKKIGQVWSVRIGIGYRALAIRENDDMIWFWIGSHADYDKLVGR